MKKLLIAISMTTILIQFLESTIQPDYDNYIQMSANEKDFSMSEYPFISYI